MTSVSQDRPDLKQSTLDYDVLATIASFVDTPRDLSALMRTNQTMYHTTMPIFLEDVRLDNHLPQTLVFCDFIEAHRNAGALLVHGLHLPTSAPQVDEDGYWWPHPDKNLETEPPYRVARMLSRLSNLQRLDFAYLDYWVSRNSKIFETVNPFPRLTKLRDIRMEPSSGGCYHAVMRLPAGRALSTIRLAYVWSGIKVDEMLAKHSGTLETVILNGPLPLAVSWNSRCLHVTTLELGSEKSSDYKLIPITTIFPNVVHLKVYNNQNDFDFDSIIQHSTRRENQQVAAAQKGNFRRLDALSGDLKSLYTLAVNQPVSSLHVIAHDLRSHKHYRQLMERATMQHFCDVLNDAQPETLHVLFSEDHAADGEPLDFSAAETTERLMRLHVRMFLKQTDTLPHTMAFTAWMDKLPSLTHAFFHFELYPGRVGEFEEGWGQRFVETIVPEDSKNIYFSVQLGNASASHWCVSAGRRGGEMSPVVGEKLCAWVFPFIVHARAGFSKYVWPHTLCFD
ncbi:hypothetical protein EIP91_000517 [Steccherinum ochraceum]|uniref:Uncharacterized protein n=1 Tax=Steccherinum ochraceum TaxID=92696 RepID=A0A4R0RXZ0_9APHY|nr:hypothetical protein EIP91_000517 [Steccherinum ochraceum]